MPVLPACRFIEDQILSIHGQGRCDGDTLLIAAGKGPRICFRKSCRVRFHHGFFNHAVELLAPFPLMIRSQCNFLADSRHEHLPVRLLEYITDESASF